MRTTSILRWFLFLAVGLPMLIVLVQFAGLVLRSMNDQPAAEVLRGIAIAGGILWGVVLLGLLILVAIDTLGRE